MNLSKYIENLREEYKESQKRVQLIKMKYNDKLEKRLVK